jgi:ankyrin repeat protein
MRRPALLLSGVLVAGLVHSASDTRPRPAPVASCPASPLASSYDPSNPESVRKVWKTAPRIVLAMGLTRHEQLKALLARGEDPNVCVLGASVLTLATASGDLEEVQILLDGGALPDRPTDSAGGTPLLTALGMGQWEVARLLLARGADAQAATEDRMTSLIELSGAYPSPPARRGEQAALAADLIDRGVGVDDQSIGSRTSALMMAAIRGNKELVQLLLRRGADPRLADRKGRTALDFASKKGHPDVVEVLSAATPAAVAASAAR